jgi:hypothetical protein
MTTKTNKATCKHEYGNGVTFERNGKVVCQLSCYLCGKKTTAARLEASRKAQDTKRLLALAREAK